MEMAMGIVSVMDRICNTFGNFISCSYGSTVKKELTMITALLFIWAVIATFKALSYARKLKEQNDNVYRSKLSEMRLEDE